MVTILKFKLYLKCTTALSIYIHIAQVLISSDSVCYLFNQLNYINVISSVDTEPINTFHGSYNTDTPPILLSYHQGNHYNSLVDPRRLNIGAGLGFSSLRGVSMLREFLNFTSRSSNSLISWVKSLSEIELLSYFSKHLIYLLVDFGFSAFLLCWWISY